MGVHEKIEIKLNRLIDHHVRTAAKTGIDAHRAAVMVDQEMRKTLSALAAEMVPREDARDFISRALLACYRYILNHYDYEDEKRRAM
ncbi:hypothetical protein [Agrobacterium tumefaciens]|uniref:hypothetical protein n=1 Tax=Agrobacterium tumefaciens TaxID=358 RepID=UPI001573ADA3|nr:hypothetical protein [Agrobacterium tumefaciens]NTE36668.1 hypothetical protein [Agrobacterium tumefaciens]NTE52179.1 hypothetical protein [Agrobacterium tumefaciens]